MKFILTQLFLFSFIAITLAQDVDEMPRQKFFTTGIGVTWHTRRDDLFSPLSYSGYGAELHLGSERLNAKWFKQFELWGNVNKIQSRVKGYNSAAYGFRYGIYQTWAHRILPQNKDFKLYVGGTVFHTSSMAYYPGNVNNIFSYDAPTGVGLSGFLTKDFRFFKRNWILSTQLMMPLLVYNARPSYIGFASTESLTKDFGINTLNKFINIDWRWQIDLPLSNGNRLRAIYRWDYINDTHSGKLQVGTQSLLIQSLFNIPYKTKVLK